MKKAQIKELKRLMEIFRTTKHDTIRFETMNQIITYLAACLDGIKEKV